LCDIERPPMADQQHKAVARWTERGHGDWPERFAHLTSPPQGVWICGAVAPQHPAVAVVGSRRATPAGMDIARVIARDLATAGVQVVSGMARGIDGAAHRGALEGGGSTVAVLGCGIDVCYPSEHRDLRAKIVEQGCVISEEERGASPLKYQFPKRNRLIAAVAVAVVVVEATVESGALSTARWAADLGREVLAVPGSIRSPQSEGTNLLIRDGARPFLQIGDLFEAVPELGSLVPPKDARGGRPAMPAGLTPGLEEILRRMGTTPVLPDELGAALGLSAAELAARLGSLEVTGAILSLPGGRVARTF
ncbi:MAG: DNA-processing protein DprA, partial [Candidatus Dormibacteria bacterium]